MPHEDLVGVVLSNEPKEIHKFTPFISGAVAHDMIDADGALLLDFFQAPFDEGLLCSLVLRAPSLHGLENK